VEAQRQADVLATVSVGSRLKAWKTKPIRSHQKDREPPFVQSRQVGVAERDGPEVGWSTPAARFRNVLLPDPDGPMMAVNDPVASPR
jgi:hypothetical protein